MNEKYEHKKIEKKWREKWRKDELYKTQDEVKGKENFYTLVEFPYPSGNLHIGHWYAFAVPDIFARAKRMQGYNVMFPIGFDAFGLPAENAAIKHGLDPRKWTYENIAYMEKQLQSMGNSFDWSRKIITADAEYYKWTQWLFLKLYEKGLAYKKKGTVNWCPSCQTVLANEQVVVGKCERCGTEVVQKDLEQWFFKITDYAERLLSDLDKLNWPESIKEAQKNWIGKSEGTEIGFELKGKNRSGMISVFTTRADTLFGVTYLVLAPEHPWLVQEIQNPESGILNKSEIQKYLKETKQKTEIERTDAKKEKTGVEIKGVKAVNPANGEEVLVFVADYVLGNYGTGAVMAVPAHDDRDFEFAKKYSLPIKHVIEPKFIGNTGDGAVRPELEFIKRNAVCAIVRNPKDDSYLCISWKGFLMHGLITGGIEDGEDPIEAARREVEEETGYKNLKFVRKSDIAINTFFYHRVKKQNRHAHFQFVFFDLENEEKNEVDEKEAAIHEIVWNKREDLEKFFTVFEGDFIVKILDNDDFTYTDEGILGNSGEFNEIESQKAREKITEKFGKNVVKYKLRDWLLSRQRYWGCPIPVVYDPEGNPHPVPEEHLPWLLPEDVKDFAPKGESPVATSKELKQRVEKIFGKGWKPECDTMDTFVDSSWYFNRYTDPHNDKEPFNKKQAEKWMPVRRYSGGAEHTNMHLLYSRFFQKALFDLGIATSNEPFEGRMNRGLILGPDGQKMSKSRGNVVDPDDQVKNVGADTVRMYLAFIGPFNEVGQYPWDLGGIAGIRRFLEKVWKLAQRDTNTRMHANDTNKNKKLESLLHKTIKKVTEDIENYKFNTAISSMMVFVSEMAAEKEIPKNIFEEFIRLLAPFAPHIAEEMWHNLGHSESVHLEKWPEYDESKIKEDRVTIVVQINGKIRAQFEADSGISEKEAKNKAETLAETKKWLEGKEVKKFIFVPNKIVNFVTNK